MWSRSIDRSRSIKDGKTYSLTSQPATDDNLQRYLELYEIQARHIGESGGYKRIIEDDEVRHYVMMARNHLREELHREPTINEVKERAMVYVTPIRQQRISNSVGWRVLKSYIIGLVIGFIVIVIFIIWSWK